MLEDLTKYLVEISATIYIFFLTSASYKGDTNGPLHSRLFVDLRVIKDAIYLKTHSDTNGPLHIICILVIKDIANDT